MLKDADVVKYYLYICRRIRRCSLTMKINSLKYEKTLNVYGGCRSTDRECLLQNYR